ncbi:hypothetical protein WA026_018736 [Henosepilachna vigintioctopunctata]|uniref:Phospholipase A2-like domain-containing protein n=1 Tax=Henosepilachna vigintioctopunctata TaxID=420089 RepID=A0AAW1TW82_9CUCU
MIDIRKSMNSMKKGGSFINSLIDKLPFELHLPTYQFCGPGTNLEKRLARGDIGINELDKACKEHDLAYSESKDFEKRRQADNILIQKASDILKSKEASRKEKAAALLVLVLMKAKTKIGMGAKRVSKKKSRKTRISVTPKRGGFLPILLPLLGAIGALGGGAASIAAAIDKARTNKTILKETIRHNKQMEATKGKGLVRRKKRKGKGLYIGPYQWYQKNYQ